jgi:DNA-binding transcriptional LysR family regulator
MAVRKLLEGRHIDRRLKLRELQVLAAVVECGSMVKAAGQLGMSQPAVSAAIANLEGALGVRLLDRSPRGIEPTIYSKALLKRGRVAFDELRQGLRDIEFLLDPASGEVRVGCPEGTAAGFVPAVIDRLTRLHPRVVVHVVTAQTGTQEFRELRERNVDIMLGQLFRPVVDEDVDVEVVGKNRLFVVTSSESPLARRRRVSLAELVGEPWVVYPVDNVVGSFHAEVFRRNGLELPPRHVVSFSLDVRMHLLATGRYLTMLGSIVLQYNLERWSLKRLPVDLHVPETPIAVFTLKNRTISPVARLFLDQVRAQARSGLTV